MKAIVEKIGKDVALLLVGRDEIKVELPFVLLPKGVIEGDVIDFILASEREETYTGKNQMVEKIVKMFQVE